MNLGEWKNEKHKRTNLVAYYESDLKKARTCVDKVIVARKLADNRMKLESARFMVDFIEQQIGIGV